MDYLISEDIGDETKLKFPYLVSEIISCEIDLIIHSIVENESLLNALWQILDRPPPLNALHAAYFSKANAIFLDKQTSRVFGILYSN